MQPTFGGVAALAGSVKSAWGAYETVCITAIQDEFDEAYKQNRGVTIWRDG